MNSVSVLRIWSLLLDVAIFKHAWNLIKRYWNFIQPYAAMTIPKAIEKARNTVSNSSSAVHYLLRLWDREVGIFLYRRGLIFRGDFDGVPLFDISQFIIFEEKRETALLSITPA
uniref:Uncharacterized protein n=1 Tax=Candidatus Kentrum sp. SD TaxID=2126332 RepID=A0A451BKK0_9GAMM|nr:MAG: hypothetical protein BECKSD772D_GA0070982_102638 [Candidatus Kentron sp. SD]